MNPPECSLREVSTLAVLWEHIGPVPCDAPDLMRLTEAELARRLECAAETMDGEGLVGAPPPHVEQTRLLTEVNADGPDTTASLIGLDRDPRLFDAAHPDRVANAAVRNQLRFKVGELVHLKGHKRAGAVTWTEGNLRAEPVEC